jgi:hypothetical protein
MVLAFRRIPEYIIVWSHLGYARAGGFGVGGRIGGTTVGA